MGNSSRDFALFDVTGLEGLATRQLTIDGQSVPERLEVPVGYGVWNFTNQSFVLDENNQPYIGKSSTEVENIMFNKGLIFGHEARPYELKMELRITASQGSESGDSGVLDIVAISENNAANRSGAIRINFEIQINEKLLLTAEEKEHDLTYGFSEVIEANLTNIGNVNTQIRVFTSESLRGWTTQVLTDNDNCVKGEEIGEVICTLEPGESTIVEVKVRGPDDAELQDEYEFTLAVEPVETGIVNREVIEFNIVGDSPSGLFGYSDNTLILGGGAIVFFVLISLLLLRERRK